MKLSILFGCVMSVGAVALAPLRVAAQQPAAAPEAVQIDVPAASAAATVNRIEQMINHFGGKILNSSAVAGKTEIVVQIPSDNAQHFRENVGGTWQESNSIAAPGDRIFRVTVTFK